MRWISRSEYGYRGFSDVALMIVEKEGFCCGLEKGKSGYRLIREEVLL